MWCEQENGKTKGFTTEEVVLQYKSGRSTVPTAEKPGKSQGKLEGISQREYRYKYNPNIFYNNSNIILSPYVLKTVNRQKQQSEIQETLTIESNENYRSFM